MSADGIYNQHHSNRSQTSSLRSTHIMTKRSNKKALELLGISSNKKSSHSQRSDSMRSRSNISEFSDLSHDTTNNDTNHHQFTEDHGASYLDHDERDFIYITEDDDIDLNDHEDDGTVVLTEHKLADESLLRAVRKMQNLNRSQSKSNHNNELSEELKEIDFKIEVSFDDDTKSENPKHDPVDYNLDIPPMSLSPITSMNKMAEMNKLGMKHKMQRSASYDLGLVDNQLRKMNLFGYKHITSDTPGTMTTITDININTNAGIIIRGESNLSSNYSTMYQQTAMSTAHSSRHHSVRSASDLIRNSHLKKELQDINEDVMKEEIHHQTPNDIDNNMVNLMYLMVKQGLYTAKNFNSIKQISKYNNNNNGLF